MALAVHDTVTANVGITISGIASDERGIVSMTSRVSINGQVWSEPAVTFSRGVRTQFQVVMNPAIAGRFILEVAAIDSAGNVGRDSAYVAVDREPPFLRVVAPMFAPSSPALIAAYGFDNTSRTIHLSYAADSGDEHVAGELATALGPYPEFPQIIFGGAVSVPIPPGISTLTIRARDDAGNTSSRTVSVVQGPVPTSMALSYDHACMLMPDGTAACLGRNDDGQIGDGTTTPRATPTAVAGGHRFSQLAVGPNQSCGVGTGGGLYCWGRTPPGQFGLPDISPIPRLVTGIPPISSAAAGDNYVCVLSTTGTILCWGAGSSGQLGDGAAMDRVTPAPIAGDRVYTNVLADQFHACGLTRDQDAYCWGFNHNNERGDETYTSGDPPLIQATPFHAASSHHFVSLNIGYQQGCGLRTDGQAICWGHADYGRLGSGSTLGVQRPLPVRSPEPLLSLAVPFETGCGIGVSAQLYCWGSDLGPAVFDLANWLVIPSPLNPPLIHYAYYPIPAMLGIRFKSMVGGGFYQMCATSVDGALYCFGAPIGVE